jgi:signal transduction histidine kinase/ActR/RegA family two-component response regulator
VAREPESIELRVLVFALFGGDADITRRILASVHIETKVCADVETLCKEIGRGAGAVVLTEEALLPDAATRLRQVLATQPTWSDLPLVVSASERAAAHVGLGMLGALGSECNVTVVERPIRVRTIIGVVRSALRARTRQYAARAVIAELANSELGEKEAREEAEAISRSKDEFLATVSHELRTPLNSVLGWARLLSTGDLDETATRRALASIERNALAQAQLIDDLLDVSRIISGKLRLELREVDFPAVAEAAVESIRPAMDAKEIQFVSLVDPAASRVMGDPNRLQQIIWNLLSNAIKFTPRGGHVQLALARVDSHIELAVTDTGRGVDRTFLPRLFQRFQQADGSTTRTQGGLGLGLAICRHLVELHGGTIEATSDGVGKGATFTVSLPMLSVRATPTEVRRVPPTIDRQVAFERPSDLAGLKILVVDDQPDARDLIASVIAHCGATSYEAASASEGLRIVESVRPDVIVSDVGMPGEDGYSFIGRVRALPADQGGRTPAAALTAYARAEDRRHALNAGFEMHIPKPVELGELVTALATLARIGREKR